MTVEPDREDGGVVIEALRLDFAVSGDADRRGAFPDLTDDQIDLLRARGTERRIERGDVLFREGDASYPFIVIVDGCVDIVAGFETDEVKEITSHGARRFLGELNLLTGQGVYLTAVVSEPGSVLILDVDELRRLLAEEPSLSELILRALLLRRSLLQGSGVRCGSSDRGSPEIRGGCSSSSRGTDSRSHGSTWRRSRALSSCFETRVSPPRRRPW